MRYIWKFEHTGLKIEAYEPNDHLLCYTPGTYSIVSSEDPAVLSEGRAIPQRRTSQTEKWGLQNQASGADLRAPLEPPSPSSNHSLTTTQQQVKRGW